MTFKEVLKLGEEEGALEKFSKAALTYGKLGAKEQIISSLLVRANLASDGRKKVKLICEAAMLVEDKENKIEKSLIEDLYMVANSLEAATKDKWNGVTIPWSFPTTEENFIKLIKPWNKIKLSYFLALTPTARNIINPWEFNYIDSNARQQVENAVYKKMKELAEHERFFEVTGGALPESSLLALKNEFVQYTLTKLMPIQVLIAEKISPNVYRDAFSLIYKKSSPKPAL